jgi:hypothetical protein
VAARKLVACDGPVAKHELAFDQIGEHATYQFLVVVTEALEHVLPRSDRSRAHEVVDGLPERAPALRRALAEALHFALIAAERHPEHVGADLLTETLRIELPRALDEDLVRHVGERRAQAAAGRQFGD